MLLIKTLTYVHSVMHTYLVNINILKIISQIIL